MGLELSSAFLAGLFSGIFFGIMMVVARDKPRFPVFAVLIITIFICLIIYGAYSLIKMFGG